MKVFALAPNENWIVDRMVEEWTNDNRDIATNRPHDADVIWLAADWCWRRVPLDLLKTKTVVTTIHHIVPEKFGLEAQRDFAFRDDITDVYHVPNELTKAFIKKYTTKRIELIPYWANQRLWHKSEQNKLELRVKHGLPVNAYLVGSFQRDTEGASALTENPQPKLEKGPDLLADAIIYWHTSAAYMSDMRGKYGVHVVLAGWRRQYLIKRLEEAGVSYTYFENPPFADIRELYQTLDVYPVTARFEGGPQSLIECGLLSVPVVSRPVGLATQLLPFSAVHEDVTRASPAVPTIQGLELPEGYRKYRELFEELANG